MMKIMRGSKSSRQQTADAVSIGLVCAVTVCCTMQCGIVPVGHCIAALGDGTVEYFRATQQVTCAPFSVYVAI
jgi:hypothetical protein